MGNCFKNMKSPGNSPGLHRFGKGEAANSNTNGNPARMQIPQPSSTLNWLVLYSASCLCTMSKIILFPQLVLCLPMEGTRRKGGIPLQLSNCPARGETKSLTDMLSSDSEKTPNECN